MNGLCSLIGVDIDRFFASFLAKRLRLAISLFRNLKISAASFFSFSSSLSLTGLSSVLGSAKSNGVEGGAGG